MHPSTEFERLRVVLVRTRNPLNIGSAARAMSNFGFRHLRVVSPYETAYREARSAVGASAVLAAAQQFSSVADAVADCALVVGTTSVGRRELQHPVHSLEAGARSIHRRLRSSAVALLFGSEKTGLSNQDFSHCHWLLRIPTREEHRSMNLGQAVAVCLYEFARGARAASITAKASSPKVQSASAADLERITAVMLDALRESGYLNPRATAPTEEKLRRLVLRLHLTAGDADIWLGMLRQILWKLRSADEASAGKC